MWTIYNRQTEEYAEFRTYGNDIDRTKQVLEILEDTFGLTVEGLCGFSELCDEGSTLMVDSHDNEYIIMYDEGYNRYTIYEV